MPAADDAKTKSGHKNSEGGTPPLSAPAKWNTFWRAALPQNQSGLKSRLLSKKSLLYATGIVVAVLALLAPMVFFQPPKATLHVSTRTYKLDISNTQAQREQGLSGRASLASDQGMLFVFESENPECFWMKDMRFPIDIIWLNAEKRVVHIERRVSPDTFPTSFCPSEPAKYVIELSAGEAQNIKTGQTLSF